MAEDDDPEKDWGPDGPPTDVRVSAFVEALEEPNTAPHPTPAYEAGRALGYEEGLARGRAEGRADVRAADFDAGVDSAFAAALEYLRANTVPQADAIVAKMREGVRRT